MLKKLFILMEKLFILLKESFTFIALLLVVSFVVEKCIELFPKKEKWEYAGVAGNIVGIYFDRNNISYLSNYIARVRIRDIFIGEDREKMAELIKSSLIFEHHWGEEETQDPSERAETFLQRESLDEINCKTYQIRVLKVTFYSFKGDVLDSSSDPTPWENILPGTIIEGIAKYVCSHFQKVYLPPED